MTVLIPLSENYGVSIAGADTVNNHVRIRVSENTAIKIEMDTVVQNITIPVKLTHNLDTPLVIIRADWGEPYPPPYFTKQPIFKGDTSVGKYTLHCSYPRPSLFTKVAYIRTNHLNFRFVFKGVRVCRKREE